MKTMRRLAALILAMLMLLPSALSVLAESGSSAAVEQQPTEKSPDFKSWLLVPGEHRAVSGGAINSAWQTDAFGYLKDRPAGIELFPHYDEETGEYLDAASYWLDFEYYRDETTTKTLEIRMRNTTQNAMFVIKNNVISISTTMMSGSTLDPKLSVISKDGWNHIRIRVFQTSEIAGRAVSHRYGAELWLNGTYVGGASGLNTAWDSYGWGLYDVTFGDDGEPIFSSEKYANFRAYFYGGEFFYSGSKLNTERALLYVRNAYVNYGAEAPSEIYPLHYEVGAGRLPFVTEALISDHYSGCAWTPIPDYDYSYELITARNYYEVSEHDQPLEDAFCEGYDFLGWYLNGDFGGVPIDSIVAYEIGEMTLYARFGGSFFSAITEGGRRTELGDRAGVRLPQSSDRWLGSNAEIYAGGELVTLTGDTEFAPYLHAFVGSATLGRIEGGGLCFTVGIGRDLIEMLRASGTRHEVGTLIVPRDLLGDTAPTVDAMQAAGIPFANLTAKEVGIRASGDRYLFGATLANLHPQNYARGFVAVSYLKIGDTYLYTSSLSTTLWQTALATLADTSVSAESTAEAERILSRVVVLNGELQIANNTAFYTSPYSVSHEDGILTVTNADGGLEGDSVYAIVINGRVYTRGWTVTDGVLSGAYIAP